MRPARAATAAKNARNAVSSAWGMVKMTEELRTSNLRGMRPTLFEFAGGSPAFLALATAHHARCLADPELNHPFSHEDQHPQHVERLAAYWAEVLGGPPGYSTACGGDQHGVLAMHAG